MPSKLERLRSITEVVADTGDIGAIKRYRPTDATTNPSLLLKAAGLPDCAPLLERARATAVQEGGSSTEQLANCCDDFAVRVGCEILKLIPGRISTEVDARLSFDTDATIRRAESLIARYAAQGIDSDRILIKIASTWEGIRAAEALTRCGIDCNLTLLFNFAQAKACADAGVFLISPFVGRILDWYLANTDTSVDSPADDPGVQSVRRIYNYFKHHDYPTLVMGASFRNTGQIEALAGCDRLTISPALLQALDDDTGDLQRSLDPEATRADGTRDALTEPDFRYQLNDDAMATEKLAEGIRNFVADQVRLERLLAS